MATLEACIDSVESALAAQRGGATRFELCANLVIGGTTPSPGLLKAVKGHTCTRTHALLRPRFGDFLYTDYEFDAMLFDAENLLELGADGIVSGCLLPDGSLDFGKLERLIALCHEKGASFTLHRAFDVCRDPFETLEACKKLGVDVILTSGQKNSCLEGAELLQELWQRKEDVEILIGAGVNAAAIRTLRREIPGADCFHMSGKQVLQSGMEYRREGVSMGLPSMSEFEVWRTEEAAIREAADALGT